MGRQVDVSVVTSGHDVADARLHREVAALQRAGLRVEVLGLGQAEAGPPGVQVRTWSRGSMFARGLRAVTLPLRADGAVLLTLDPDVVPAALVVGRLRGRKVVADVHEDYVALLADRGWARRALPWLQRAAAVCVGLAGRTDLTVVADEHVPPGPAQSRHRMVVRNLPDPALLPPPSPVPATPELRAAYVGDVRTSRGLRTMIEAVAAAPGWELDIVGPVAPADAGWVSERLAEPDVAGRVKLHGRLPPSAAWQVVAGASVGLALFEDTPAFRDAVPTKLYEYLACGMALLVTPLPRMISFVGSTDELSEGEARGAVVQDAPEAAAQLRAWAADPAALAQARRAALAWAQEHLRSSPWDDLATAVSALGLANNGVLPHSVG